MMYSGVQVDKYAGCNSTIKKNPLAGMPKLNCPEVNK